MSLVDLAVNRLVKELFRHGNGCHVFLLFNKVIQFIFFTSPSCNVGYQKLKGESLVRQYASHHGAYGGEETFEAFTQKYVNFFKKEADDVFELSRGLNNCMSMDMVPAPEVLVAAMQCAKKHNSFSLALRVLAGLRQKVSPAVYKEYISELRPAMDELGVPEPSEVGVDW